MSTTRWTSRSGGIEEAQELLVAVARLALGKDRAGGDIQSGEEGGGAMADVAVRHAFDVAESEGQEGLGAPGAWIRLFSTKKGSVESRKCFCR